MPPQASFIFENIFFLERSLGSYCYYCLLGFLELEETEFGDLLSSWVDFIPKNMVKLHRLHLHLTKDAFALVSNVSYPDNICHMNGCWFS